MNEATDRSHIALTKRIYVRMRSLQIYYGNDIIITKDKKDTRRIVMGRTILCNKCKSTFNEDILASRDNPNICPVCGADLTEEESPVEAQKEKKKWYYYKEGGGTLTMTVYGRPPLYTFEAVDLEDAKRQLKEVLPNCWMFNKTSPETVHCPYCNSTDIKIVPKKFSLLTGFATNKLERVCAKCMRKF